MTEPKKTADFFFHPANIFNHINEIAINPHGGTIYFYLDGKWKIYSAEDDVLIHHIESAINMCAFLNFGEFRPTGKRVGHG